MPGNVVILRVGAMAGDGRQEAQEHRLELKNKRWNIGKRNATINLPNERCKILLKTFQPLWWPLSVALIVVGVSRVVG